MYEISELSKAVENIINDVWETSGEVEYLDLTLKSTGYYQSVDFIGITLWDSNDMDMPEDEEGNHTETIEEHLRRRMTEEIEKISRIKVT